ncbi:MAG: dUTP diphosphatase [Actinobacteria bacterium]|nr:dUTP diphosphatase [Actinomycetota bacterium]NBO07032.1 dUTP diphosphatase [Actinomycetota bacterium]NBO47275.1 dUTP diphosphatase [Actinomycetota bacterium]NBP12021.1 dUTP diphosphatase [Actinomycetota bacterium]NBP42811.1 dUTP diphosphatase [Actinomycetota bacterium]
MRVLITQLDKELPMPTYAKAGDAGADIYSAIDITIAPGMRALVPTGIAIALADGYGAFVHPRSGLAIKYGVGLVNAPGTIDAGYRGEISVIVINHDQSASFEIKRGDRIAQLVFQRVERAEFVPVEELPGSNRSGSGFGSSGRS